jgi:hypothetical protein
MREGTNIWQQQMIIALPARYENKGAAVRGAVSFQLARLAAEWGFGLLEAGAPMC